MGLVFYAAPSRAAAPARKLEWKKAPDRVSADIDGVPLEEVLALVAEQTGWQVFVEPKSEHTTNVKFEDRSPSDALKLLLGDISFAVLPQTNGPNRLMVFRTKLNDATQLVGVKKDPKEDTSKPIPNELVVTLKAGAKIDELAKKLGALVVGRIEELNTYRLRFETAEAAEAARKLLAEEADVVSVDNNYNTQRPSVAEGVQLSSFPELNLTPSSPTDCSKVIIGLIDTDIPRNGNPLEAFLQPSINVAGGSTSHSPSSPPHGEAMYQTILSGYRYSNKNATTAPISILPVNVYGANAQASTFDVANGIYRAITAGAKIINLSLGSEGQSALLANIIRQGQSQDVLFIAAAGNQPTTTPVYPAALPEVIAVTASDRSGGIASYANRGDFVDVIAPGTSIFSDGSLRYLSTGTSVSTAYVSGLAAALSDPCKKSFGSVDTQIRQSLAVRR